MKTSYARDLADFINITNPDHINNSDATGNLEFNIKEERDKGGLSTLMEKINMGKMDHFLANTSFKYASIISNNANSNSLNPLALVPGSLHVHSR